MASYWRHKDQQGRTSICFALSLVLLTKLGLKSKEGDKTRTQTVENEAAYYKAIMNSWLAAQLGDNEVSNQ